MAEFCSIHFIYFGATTLFCLHTSRKYVMLLFPLPLVHLWDILYIKHTYAELEIVTDLMQKQK